ncbi:SWIRM domain-containing protein [Myxozyma melibiosi]|uniref:SWIRM domain-containing protein n=1 Tax=Myxozyma melibiosi TaxID=54550 RepID=A0ABR1F6F9_9ASCO
MASAHTMATPLPTPVMAASEIKLQSPTPASKPSAPSISLLSPPPSPFAESDDSSVPKAADLPLFAADSDLRHAPLFRPLVDVVRANNAVAAAAAAATSSYSAAGPSSSSASKLSAPADSACFRTTVFEQYSKAPRRWLQIQRKFLRNYRPQYSTVITVSSPAPAPTRTTPRASRVTKARSSPVSSPTMTTRNSMPSSPRQASKKRSSPTEFTAPLPRSSPAASPVRRAQSTSPDSSPRTSTVHDIDFDDIPDFCPPVSSLDGTKGLRTDWKGNAMDLSADPDRHLLHPHEIQLASVLRLPCAVYLDSKKRIFAERVFRARRGLQFRRTDSQKACRIDVNKATRLFVAFERVGWFDDKWIAPYLNN